MTKPSDLPPQRTTGVPPVRVALMQSKALLTHYARARRPWYVCAVIFFAAVPAIAAPSQQDVFKSISQNVGNTNDTGHLLLILLITTLIAASLIVLSQRQKRQVSPKALNHPKKLLKEVTRQIDVSQREVKRLKAIAEEKGYSSPLVLMLCPSLLKEKKK